jgi:hypothetical protein
MTADPISGDPRQKNVVAAVMAGVAAYIEEQERAADSLPRRRREAAVPSLWPIFGREEIMRMRTMWQRRLV